MSALDPVGLLRRMVETPSPSGGERGIAQLLVAEMTARRFSARVDAVGNAVGEIGPPGGPTVMLVGHLDTEGATLPVAVRDGRLYGRGSVDAKGALAAMVCAAAASRFPGRLVVVGAVEEEMPSSRGAHHLGRTHPAPDALLIGEPSGWSSVVLGYKGRTDFRYRVRCAPGHSTRPTPRAAELAAAAWRTFQDAVGPRLSHAVFDLPGTTLHEIRGDLDAAEAVFSVRSPLGFAPDDLLAVLRDRLPEGEITLVSSVPACRVGRRDPVVRALSSAIDGQGVRPTLKVKTATSDMNTLAGYWSVPMACYGPGDSRLDHSADEHLPLDDYLRAIAVLVDALDGLGERLTVGDRP
ncbi:M20/M25/M40 family metallo-hydrolase [Micromonospora sp. NPDC048898]|uniref:M20/M25/M40 family metallo-hydrolase n=1 Tax=Micromonospora sp. NPDC048898 TaxID=3364260 RepID=UPI0037165D67